MEILKEVKNSLRSIAKKSKNIKFTTGLAIAFLMLGVNAFSEEVSISTESMTRVQIMESLKEMYPSFDELRAKNNKKISGAKLELIKLMEQGEQIVKSPWSSWQFGINFYTDKMGGKYRGYKDKVLLSNMQKKNFKEQLSEYFQDYFGNLNMYYSVYGLAELNIPEELKSTFTLGVSITPKQFNRVIEAPKLVLKSDLTLQEIKNITTKQPEAPVIEPPKKIIPPEIKFPGIWTNGNAGKYSNWLTSGGEGNLYQTSAESGDVLKVVGKEKKIYLKDYEKGKKQVKASTMGGEAPKNSLEGIANTNNYFLSLEDVPYAYLGRNLKLGYLMDENLTDSQLQSRRTGPYVIYFETEGNRSGQTFNKLLNENYINQEEYNDLEDLKKRTDYHNNSKGELYFTNKGFVEIGGAKVRYFHNTFWGGSNNRVDVIENRGKIIAMNYEDIERNLKSFNNAIYVYSPDTSGWAQQIFTNHKNGEISLYSERGVVMSYVTAGGTLHNGNGAAAFINDGEINSYGRKNTGIFIARGKGELSQKSTFIMTKPMYMYGDYSTGLYVLNGGDYSNKRNGVENLKNQVKFVIGNKNPNKIQEYKVKNNFLKQKYSLKPLHNAENEDGYIYDPNFTEKNIGIYYKASNKNHKMKTKLPQLDIEKYSKFSVGVYSKNGEVEINEGNIKVLGGENNTALFTEYINDNERGKVTYNGNILMSESDNEGAKGNKKGKGNIIAYASEKTQIDINGNIETSEDNKKFARDSIAVYSKGVINLTGKTHIDLKANKSGKNAGLYTENAGVINIATKDSHISINGIKDDGEKTNEGIGLYAKSKGVINANAVKKEEGLKIEVKDGASAIVVDGKDSKINAQYSTIDYDGSGYVLYTKDKGKIDVTNSLINLSGSAVLMEKDAKSTTSEIDLTGSAINVFSNDVTILDLKNLGTVNLSNLDTKLTSLTNGALAVAGTKDGVTYDQFKIAKTQNTEINLDSNLDMSKAVKLVDEHTNDYQFYRRLRINKSKINLENGNKILAVVSDKDLRKMGEESLVALKITSNDAATTVNDTQINLAANTKIIGDKKGYGNGAIGIYIDYGQINIENGAKIEIEKENISNDKGIGIYASGSKVKNAGDISVAGNKAIGILSINSKLHPTSKENVVNSGKIYLSGNNSIGIFNNSNGNVENNGEITIVGRDSIALNSKGKEITNTGIISVNGQTSVGIDADDIAPINNGKIILSDVASSNEANIGMFNRKKGGKVINKDEIIVGKNSIGLYADKIESTGGKIIVGENAIGNFSLSQTSDSKIEIDSELEIGEKGIGLLLDGNNTIHTTLKENTKMRLSDNSFGVVAKNKGGLFGISGEEQSYIKSLSRNEVIMGKNGTYIFVPNDKNIRVENKTNLKATGDTNYGIYSSGSIENSGNIDFSKGLGNIGIFSTHGGNSKNLGIIKVGKTNVEKQMYSIGMAGGYYNQKTQEIEFGATTENIGEIHVNNDNSIGMYAVGKDSKAINRGKIIISGANTIGMYLDKKAMGENYGIIKTAPNNTKDGIRGVVVTNGAIFKNYGIIDITGNENSAIYMALAGNKGDTVNQSGTINGKIEVKKTASTGKTIGTRKIEVPGNGTAKVFENNIEYIPIAIDKVRPISKPREIMVGETKIKVDRFFETKTYKNKSVASELGMYVDTSGINFTNPIKGLEKLTGLKEINLIVGNEATKYTNKLVDKSNDGKWAIRIGKNIFAPYNKEIKKLALVNPKVKFNVFSGNLTWMASPVQDLKTWEIKEVILAKLNYKAFAPKGNETMYNFLDGLEQRYGVEQIGTRENILFYDKLNNIKKGEPKIFAQAVDEMMGHQYANVQQRLHQTGEVLDKEFNYLKKEWETKSKDSNKVKAFGMNGEYKTDSAGIIDYKNHAQGFAYLHENETIKLGATTGWYGGFIQNHFKFDDIGKSSEKMYQAKLGIFKSYPFDHNNSLNWTVSGETFVGYNRMNRKFLVVDEIFEGKSKYWSYGLGINNELSKTFRLSEDISVKPYGGLKLEYGRFQKIKEKAGEVRLEVKANDYYSIRPELGVDFGYKHHLSNNKTLTASLGLSYENELGQVADTKNKARVAYTKADWFNIRGEKEDRRGNLKTDLNIGLENERYGVTANVGYDTKGNNVRGGLGLRIIF